MHDRLIEPKRPAQNLELHWYPEFMADLLRHSFHLRRQAGDCAGVLAQIPYRPPGFVNGRSYLRARIFEKIMPIVPLRVSDAGLSLQQRRHAHASLNQSVMHFARQPVALVQNCLKAGPQLAQSNLVDTAPPVSSKHKPRNHSVR